MPQTSKEYRKNVVSVSGDNGAYKLLQFNFDGIGAKERLEIYTYPWRPRAPIDDKKFYAKMMELNAGLSEARVRVFRDPNIEKGVNPLKTDYIEFRDLHILGWYCSQNCNEDAQNLVDKFTEKFSGNDKESKKHRKEAKMELTFLFYAGQESAIFYDEAGDKYHALFYNPKIKRYELKKLETVSGKNINTIKSYMESLLSQNSL